MKSYELTNNVCKAIIEQILPMSYEDKIKFFNFTYNSLKEPLTQVAQKSGIKPEELILTIIYTGITVDNEANSDEHELLKEAYKILGCSYEPELTDQIIDSYFISHKYSGEITISDLAAKIAGEIPAESRTLFFALLAIICSFDNDISQPEYDFLYRIASPEK